MVPIVSRVGPDGSDETAEGVRPAAVAVRPDEEGADAEALRPSEDALLCSEPVCLRADPGFVGWLAT
jgi:hypothetical protein